MLEGESLVVVREACEARGLAVLGARRRGAILELIPATLDALPDAATLRALADDLGGDGVRYVTLALEPER